MKRRRRKTVKRGEKGRKVEEKMLTFKGAKSEIQRTVGT